MRLSVQYFNDLFEEIGGYVKMFFVYIREAHARDEWPLGRIVDVTQPKTTEERIKIANQFACATGFRIPILVDGADNYFSHTWRAWPESFFLFQDGKLSTRIYPTGIISIDRMLLRTHLRNLIRNIQINSYRQKGIDPPPFNCPVLDSCFDEYSNAIHDGRIEYEFAQQVANAVQSLRENPPEVEVLKFGKEKEEENCNLEEKGELEKGE